MQLEQDFIVPSVRRLLSWNWSRLYSTFCQEIIKLELRQTLLYLLSGDYLVGIGADFVVLPVWYTWARSGADYVVLCVSR